MELFGGLGGFAVDVDVGSEFLCECGVFGAAADGCDSVAEFGGELDSEVAEAADALDGYEVGGERAAVAEGVEGGDSCAEERAGFDVGEGFGDGCEGFDGGDHVLRVAAVVGDAGDFEVAAVAEVSAAAGEAGAVLAAVPADSYALAFFPRGDAGAELVDDAGDFVAGDARVLDSGPLAFFGEDVAVADAAGLHLDEDMSGGGRGNLALDDLEFRSGAGDLCGFHSCHASSYEFWIMVREDSCWWGDRILLAPRVCVFG